MAIRINRYDPKKAGLKLATSLVAMAGAIAFSHHSYAQDEDSSGEGLEEEQVLVTGMRRALNSAQDIKRNSGTVVDSITAKDLGSFPDKSVAEALQRVAGITVNRFAASSDTAHFSAEPSGVIVRGLQFVRNEFNGRDTFSANSSRGLSWTDVSPELLSGVDTYKNQMAELVEGGIAGTVNLKTRVPFDQDGMMAAANVRANYGDLAESVTPEFSGLLSNRWMTDIGEFGFLANLAYSEVETRSQGVQQYRQNRFRDVYENAPSLVYIPAIINMRDNSYFRERTGVALAAQWQDLDERFVLTAQFNRSEYENAWEEYVVQSYPADLTFSQSLFAERGPYDADDQTHNDANPQVAPGTDNFTFDDDGLFQTGTVVTGHSWWGNGSAGESQRRGELTNGDSFVDPCYQGAGNSWYSCEEGATNGQRGIDVGTITRGSKQTNVTQDFSLNLKWAISDTVRANFDVQWVDSTIEHYDMEVGYKSIAQVAFDLTGDRARMDWVGAGPNSNLSPAIGDDASHPWDNPNNYWINYLMDHVEDSEGDQFSLRSDIEFDINAGGFESFKTGVRYANREQLVRSSTYNWQNVSNTWTDYQQHHFNLDRTSPAPDGLGDEWNQRGFTGYPEGHYETRNFSGEWFGLDNDYVFANMDMIQDREGLASVMGAQALGFTGGTGWDPICSNFGDRASEIEGTCFTPSELAEVTETSYAAYWQANFGDGKELFGIPFSGNIGVRYIKTDVESKGGIAFPRLGDGSYFTWEFEDETDPETGDPVINPGTGEPYQNVIRTPDLTRTILGCAPNPETQAGPATIPFTTECYLDADDVAFMNDADVVGTSKATHHNLLPSFNIKFDLTDELLLRFALSRSMSRPDMGNLRNYVGIGATLPSQSDVNDPLWEKNADGEIVGANVFYSGGAQNPFLKPVIADGLDIGLEWYFAEVGSLTLNTFWKEFGDYIQNGLYNRTETNNGVTRTAQINGPLNGDGAKIQGYEIAYTTFFDFLPAPFDGLGIQTNYTNISNDGIPNQNLSLGAAGTNITGQAPDSVNVGGLESLSENAYNFVTMYEKGDIAARLAYSWRSEYVVTVVDCCVAYPVLHEDFGSLDGSIKYTINDNFEVSFSASNILNSETVTVQQVENIEDGALKLPTGNFQNDRRFTLGVSFKY